MMGAWFIDALDARAGLAFASLRSADLQDDQGNIDMLAVHIAAPDFQAETVASRAAAFAASRGSFQLGVFTGESEVAFENLEDVIEFVRRSYVAGGGGDGDGGIGGGVPPVPDLPLEGGGPVESRETDSAIEPMFDLVVTFKQAVEKLALDRIVFDEPDGIGSGASAMLVKTIELDYKNRGSSSDPVNACASAVVMLVDELFRRCPNSPSTDALAMWWEAVRALGAAASRLGLCRAITKGALGSQLSNAALRLFGNRGEVLFDGVMFARLPPPTKDHGLLLALEVLTGFCDDDLYFLFAGTEVNWDWYFSRRQYFWKGSEFGDRFDDLSRWPLPDALCHASDLPLEKASVADFLCKAIGAPTSMAWTPPSLEIMLLAVMHLECDRSPVVAESQYTSPVMTAWRIALSDRARLWLSRQMPQRAFAVTIEQEMFNKVAKVRYA
ncbi:hypothetical protein A6U97_26500 [Agrobacterium tumefaciens]|uniref:hypothetical protein n=1 Tax=Agrobacterium tumefaciens TaxID=358 RepID=UPI00080FDA95|nr:hypothetical protein A6U97_26500 [Agrobacterium tumefaciens]